MADSPRGFFVTDRGHVLIATPAGTVAYGMQPFELRGFARDLLNAADRVEARAAEEASAALKKAGRVQ